MYSIHHNADLWGPVDPYKFYPERHATKRHPIAYLSFGAGPRNCIGTRFGLLEMKIALVRLVQTFTVLKGDKMDNGSLDLELTFIRPERVVIKLEHRTTSK